MAFAADAPKGNFRLSMLVYDTRFRSITIQIVVLLLFGALLAWLFYNVSANLAAKGRPFSYGFLFSRAGYDIAQTLIPFTNDNTHFRALIVGLLNTLVVAIVGCILATIIGVIVGVLRLSKNWLIARLMTIYVEIFRNIPVLLWILVIFVPLTELTPSPNAFKMTPAMQEAGQVPPSSMAVFGTVAFTNRGTYIPWPAFERPFGSVQLGGVPVNLTLLAALVVLAAGLWINRIIVRRARAVQEATGIRPVTWWKRLLVLFGPLVLVLLAAGFYLDIPQPPTKFNFVGGVLLPHPFTALTLALALYTGAFIAEIVRSGIHFARAVRGRLCAGSAPQPHDESGDSAAGAARDHPALDQPIPEPDQEHLAGCRGQLHGFARHAGRGHAEPDRTRVGKHAADDGDLSDDQPHDLVGDEYLQPVRAIEGALR